MQAIPSEQAMTWRDSAEVRELYSVYVGRESDSVKQGMLQQLLGISASEAESLKDLVGAGEFHLEQGSRKEEAFF